MDSIVITWRELLIVVALILAVYIAEMLLLMRTGGGVLRRRRHHVPENVADTRKIQAEINALSERIAAIEQYLQKIQAEQDSESTPYNRAIPMARLGRDPARISEGCGISHGEAELIVSMHRPRE